MVEKKDLWTSNRSKYSCLKKPQTCQLVFGETFWYGIAASKKGSTWYTEVDAWDGVSEVSSSVAPIWAATLIEPQMMKKEWGRSHGPTITMHIIARRLKISTCAYSEPWTSYLIYWIQIWLRRLDNSDTVIPILSISTPSGNLTKRLNIAIYTEFEDTTRCDFLHFAVSLPQGL